MILLLPLFVLVLCFLVHSIWKESKFRKTHKLFPGPMSFPILGGCIQALLSVTGNEINNYERVNTIRKKYGPTMFLKSGVQNFVVTSDPKIIKEILHSNDWTARFPSHQRFKEPRFWKDLGIVASAGESWREVRRFTLRTLKNFGFGELRLSEQILEEELEHFLVDIDRQRLEGGDEVHIDHLFRVPSTNVVWRIIAGERYAYDDAYFLHILKCVDLIENIEIGMDLEWVFPILRFIPGFAHSRKVITAFNQIYDLFREIMADRRLKGDYKISQTNYIDNLLQKIDEDKKNGDSAIYTDEQFLVTCMDLLGTASDTTATALNWAILLMMLNPEVQRKVQEELDAVVGNHRTPTMIDRIKLPYTEAVFLEINRVASTVPMVCRTTTCDTELNGYFVPKDTMGAVLFASVHNDPEIWGDPENFRPERFLDENMKIINEENTFAFGGGKRVCPGFAMAKATIFMFITTMLQKYTFKLSENRPIPTLEAIGGVTCRVSPKLNLKNHLN